jgi:hypothetical protein
MEYRGVFNVFLGTDYCSAGPVFEIFPVPWILRYHVIIFRQQETDSAEMSTTCLRYRVSYTSAAYALSMSVPILDLIIF